MTTLMTHLTVIPKEYLMENTAVVDIVLIRQTMSNFKRIFDDVKWNAGACCGDLKKNGSMLMAWQKLLELLKVKFDYDVEEEAKEEDGPAIVE